MLRLGEPRPIEPPPVDDLNRKEYVAADGEHRLLFSDWGEYAMGASFWKAMLVARNGRKTKLPYALSLTPLAPWSPDGRRFAYLATEKLREDGRVLLGDVDGGIRWLALPTWAWVILWSPAFARLVVVGLGWSRVAGRDGRVIAAHEWRQQERTPVWAAWLASGDRFFVVRRREDRGTTIHLFDADGSEIDERPLDAAALVPYDAQRFTALGRGTFTLRLGPATRGIADLLDRWSDVQYDPAQRELRLAVYRPTSEVGPEPSASFAGGGAMSAVAEQRWIALPIGE